MSVIQYILTANYVIFGLFGFPLSLSVLIVLSSILRYLSCSLFQLPVHSPSLFLPLYSLSFFHLSFFQTRTLFLCFEPLSSPFLFLFITLFCFVIYPSVGLYARLSSCFCYTQRRFFCLTQRLASAVLLHCKASKM